MSTRKPKPRGRSFARGNKAASKGEPRTVPMSVRLPLSTAEKLAALAGDSRSRADVVIELIDEAAEVRGVDERDHAAALTT
jgi:hypothetical protein